MRLADRFWNGDPRLHPECVMVLAKDYDSLAADNQRLREALTVIAKTGYGHGGELAEITARAALTTANGEVT
jgi:hypothetical protein